jgi:hypothetical protein
MEALHRLTAEGLHTIANETIEKAASGLACRRGQAKIRARALYALYDAGNDPHHHHGCRLRRHRRDLAIKRRCRAEARAQRRLFHLA